ncbi:hypothetical protein B0H15DRAFT_238666 [Mycena belliarum]|uniref:Uncharacterized protein n=1 Tax=Mycena belliarum TaxID=1033014 RepID=A0AAD6XQ91_9AGAR|nr:hypothetical protein B0H15DRAFT_238666 [Mycena belliae]
MDGNSKLVSARNAQRKLEQVAAAQKAADARAMEALLAAIADFKERIVPVFAAVKSQETQLEGLDELKAQAERATRLGGEVTILRAEGVTLRQEIRDAKAQRDAAVEREEQKTAQILVLQRKLDAAEGEARTEIRRLKGFLERNADDRTALRSKIHVLQQEKDVLGRQVEDLTAENRAVRARASDYSDDLEIEEEVFASEYSQSSPVSSHPTLTHRSSVPQTPNPPVPAFDFEGMPRPGFGSDWQLNRGTKRKEREIPPGFPIALDRGRTTIAVQLGPKHSRRVKVR